MKGKWKVQHQHAGGEMFIRVCRVLNLGEPVHGGNLEYYPQTFESDWEAEVKARELNEDD